jgi:hypothetical protein
MNRLRSVLGFLTVFVFAASALMSNAAFGADKQYSIVISPASGTSPLSVTASLTNRGNSSFKSFTLNAPTFTGGAAYTITAITSNTRGNATIVNGGAGIKVDDINLPTGTGQTHSVTMTVRASGPCGTPLAGNWLATLWTGTGLTGQTFAQVGSGSTFTSIGFTCYTLSYTAGSGGTISGTSPQTVPAGGSGSPVTAVPGTVPSPGFYFVKWSDNNSTVASRTDTNVQANISATAVFAGKMSFTTQPHGNLAGGLIGPVTVTTTAPDNSHVTLALDPSGPDLTGASALVVGGVATFNNVATAQNTSVGSYQLKATSDAPYVMPVNSDSFEVTASTGTVTCNTSTTGDPSPGSSIAGDDGPLTMSGVRWPNKVVSPCDTVPYLVTASASEHKVTVLWDQVSQPNLVLSVDLVWPPELVASDGLPTSTKYDIGFGTFLAAHCLSKSAPPAGPPEQIGTLGADISGTLTPIPITFNAGKPAGYPFPIVIASSVVGTDPERMLVISETSPGSGQYNVVRGTGLTPQSAHANSAAVMWTPMPIDVGGVNAPNGSQVQTCIVSESFTTLSTFDPLCPSQSSEPLKACIQTHSILWVVGDWAVTR